MKKQNSHGFLFSRMIICAVGVFLVSCRPVVDLPVTNTFDGVYYITANSYTDVFTAIWKGINVNYVYWDIEPTGVWDDAWDEYKPKFDALGALGTQGTLFGKYLEDMVSLLHDGHLKIATVSFSPQLERVKARFAGGLTDDANPITLWLTMYNDWSGDPIQSYGDPILAAADYRAWNFVDGLIGPQYLSGDLGDDWGWATNGDFHVAQGKIPVTGGHITYLHFNEFDLQGIIRSEYSIEDETERYVTLQVHKFWEYADASDCKGIIFDLRGNTGGNASDIAYLLHPFLEEDLHFAYTRTKKGEGRLNYTPWTPYIIRAVTPENRITQAGKIPIVALVNDFSISSGELMPLAIKSIPNGHLIGTQTFGATGPRIGDESPEAFKDGSFTVRWATGTVQITLAGAQTRGIHFENYEGVGIEPDQRIPFSRAAFTNNGNYDAGGADAQLEAAIQHIEEMR
jgi:hypothetical protein